MLHKYYKNIAKIYFFNKTIEKITKTCKIKVSMYEKRKNMRIKNKIILFIMVLFMMMILTPKVQAYTTPNYFSNRVWWLPLQTGLESAITESLSDEGATYRIVTGVNQEVTLDKVSGDPNTQTIIESVGSTLTKLGYDWNGKRDFYQTHWYTLKNANSDGSGMEDLGTTYVVKSGQHKQVMGIQWTSTANCMYMARIFITYTPRLGLSNPYFTCYVTVITNDKVNEKISNELAKEAEAAKKEVEILSNFYTKDMPNENSEYTYIINWVNSDASNNEAKQLKELAMTKDGVETLKKWRNEINKHIRRWRRCKR